MQQLVVVFAEGSFKNVFEEASKAQAISFTSGISLGAGYYGAGSCTGYLFPEDETEILQIEGADELERAREAVAKLIAKQLAKKEAK